MQIDELSVIVSRVLGDYLHVLATRYPVHPGDPLEPMLLQDSRIAHRIAYMIARLLAPLGVTQELPSEAVTRARSIDDVIRLMRPWLQRDEQRVLRRLDGLEATALYQRFRDVIRYYDELDTPPARGGRAFDWTTDSRSAGGRIDTSRRSTPLGPSDLTDALRTGSDGPTRRAGDEDDEHVDEHGLDAPVGSWTPPPSPPARRVVNVWTDAAGQLETHTTALIHVNVGQPRRTAQGTAFNEPSWRGRQEHRLGILLLPDNADELDVRDGIRLVVLPAIGDTTPASFHVVPRRSGQLGVRVRIHLADDWTLLQEVVAHLAVAEARRTAQLS